MSGGACLDAAGAASREETLWLGLGGKSELFSPFPPQQCGGNPTVNDAPQHAVPPRGERFHNGSPSPRRGENQVGPGSPTDGVVWCEGVARTFFPRNQQ